MFVYVKSKNNPQKVWWIIECSSITNSSKDDGTKYFSCNYSTILSWSLDKLEWKNRPYWPLKFFNRFEYNSLEKLTEQHFLDFL